MSNLSVNRHALLSGATYNIIPSLELRYAVDRTLTPRRGAATITFTRATARNYYSSSGVVTSAGSGNARFDYHPATLASLGLRIGEARTNLALRSEELDNASWTKSQTTITANSVAAPDGNTTADTIVESVATAGHTVSQTVTITASDFVTLSAFIKATGGSQRYVRLSAGGATNGFRATFNPNTGAITNAAASFGTGTAGTARTETLPNGWFRVSVSGKIAPAGTSCPCSVFIQDATGFPATHTGDGSSGAYVWGMQVESGAAIAFPGSYIPTTTAAVTVNAETTSTATLGVGASAGTVAINARTALGSGTQTLWSLNDATANERIYLERNASNEIHAFIVDGGVTQADLNLGVVADDTNFKVAFAWAANDAAASLNGAAVVTDSSLTLPTPTQQNWGHNYTSANFWNSTIARSASFTKRLPNPALQALAT